MRKIRFGRTAVSNIIGGIIVLSIILTALTSIVIANRQYDAYEQLNVIMSQKDINRASENIVASFPGLVGGVQAKCGSCTLNQYNMSLANEGGVGVQLVRVYINSTTQLSQPNQKGCSSGPCILNPSTTPASFTFAQSDAYIAAGEFNHIVRLWLPVTNTLPNVTLTPSNSIWIITNRGRVFTFNWPIPTAGQAMGGAGTPLSLEAGSMKIAYNGTYNSGTDTCHKETAQPLPAGGKGTTLYFVNPWITPTILQNVPATLTISTSCSPECLYVSVYSEDTLSGPISFSWGQLTILTARASSNSKQLFLGGPYVGIVVNNQFYPYGTNAIVQPGQTFYLIFKIMFINYSQGSGSGDMFTGTASVNNLGPSYGWPAGSSSGPPIGSGYQSFVIALDGLYVRNNAGC